MLTCVFRVPVLNGERIVGAGGHFPALNFKASGMLSKPSPLVSSCLNCSVVPRNSPRERSESLFLSMLVNQLGAAGDVLRLVVLRAATVGDAKSSCTCGPSVTAKRIGMGISLSLTCP